MDGFPITGEGMDSNLLRFTMSIQFWEFEFEFLTSSVRMCFGSKLVVFFLES
jgi:hypothetical protein